MKTRRNFLLSVAGAFVLAAEQMGIPKATPVLPSPPQVGITAESIKRMRELFFKYDYERVTYLFISPEQVAEFRAMFPGLEIVEPTPTEE